MGQGLVGLIKGAGIDDLLWMEYVLLFDMERHVTQCNSLNHVDTVDTFYFAVEHSHKGSELIVQASKSRVSGLDLSLTYPK